MPISSGTHSVSISLPQGSKFSALGIEHGLGGGNAEYSIAGNRRFSTFTSIRVLTRKANDVGVKQVDPHHPFVPPRRERLVIQMSRSIEEPSHALQEV